MADDVKAIRDRVRGMTEAQMVRRHQVAMAWLHDIWDEVAERMDERAGDDRCGKDAQGVTMAREIKADVYAMHHKADRFGATYGGVPVARTGEGR